MAHLTFIGFVGGADLNPEVIDFAGASYDMTSADANRVVRCSSGVAVSVNVQPAQAAGTTTEFVQEGVGQITILGAGGLTIRKPAFYNAATAQQFSSVVVTILDTNEALIRGDLEAA